jgi:hypothetical protein
LRSATGRGTKRPSTFRYFALFRGFILIGDNLIFKYL